MEPGRHEGREREGVLRKDAPGKLSRQDRFEKNPSFVRTKQRPFWCGIAGLIGLLFWSPRRAPPACMLDDVASCLVFLMNPLRSIFLPLITLFAVGFSQGAEKPLKVFILAGQSNMQGHAHVRTFEHLGMDPETVPLLEKMQNEDGTPRGIENVWISSIGSSDSEKVGQLTAGYGSEARGPKIGPEFTFGIFAEEALDQPILLIKTAWGGKSIHTDFRSPGAGSYVFSEQQIENFKKKGKSLEEAQKEKAEATGHYYRLMTDHVKNVLSDIGRVYPDYDESAGYELAGFVWFQGWNDMVDSGTYPNRGKAGGYDAYSEVLAHFIRDVRKDLNAPKMPFVIGVLGVGGPVEKYGPKQQRYADTHRNFRMAMAAPAKLPEFEGNVTAVLTENYWDLELTALKAKENEVRQEMKNLVSQGKLSKEQEKAEYEKLRAERLTEEERKKLETGISNAEFHYLGSARIMAGIGKGFAEAVVELQSK